MAYQHFWNLSRWIDALGIKNATTPSVVQALQPTIHMGDHSGFTAQLVPPSAAMGGESPAVVAVRSGAQLISRAPGGTLVKYFEASVSAATRIGWTLDAGFAMANPVANLIKSDFGNEPTLSTLEMGTYAGLTNAVKYRPNFFFGNNQRHDWGSARLYIPPGTAFYCWNDTVNTAISFSIVYQDVMAARSGA